MTYDDAVTTAERDYNTTAAPQYVMIDLADPDHDEAYYVCPFDDLPVWVLDDSEIVDCIE